MLTTQNTLINMKEVTNWFELGVNQGVMLHTYGRRRWDTVIL